MVWRDEALCKDTPGTWVFGYRESETDPPEPMKQRHRLEVETCQVCPVQTECLNYAVDTGQPFGIWGGLYPHERQKLMKRRTR